MDLGSYLYSLDDFPDDASAVAGEGYFFAVTREEHREAERLLKEFYGKHSTLRAPTLELHDIQGSGTWTSWVNWSLGHRHSYPGWPLLTDEAMEFLEKVRSYVAAHAATVRISPPDYEGIIYW